MAEQAPVVPKNGVRQTDADVEEGKARDVLARSLRAASHTPDAGPRECVSLFASTWVLRTSAG